MVFALKELSRQKWRKLMWKNCDNRQNGKQHTSIMDSVHWGLGKERPDLVWTIKGGINKEILFITFANR